MNGARRFAVQPVPKACDRRRSRGAALLLVLIAVAIATILALSFLASQTPTAVVASNIDRKAKARQIAESALKMAIDYVSENPTWRTDKTSGQWMDDAALDGGTFDLFGVDETDGDLADDNTEAVTLTAIATYQGVTHRVMAIVSPGSGLAGSRLLMVVGNSGALTADEQAFQSLVEVWGFTVTVIDDGAVQASFDAAFDVNDLVFITGDAAAANVGTKILNTALGVVIAEPDLHDEFGMTTGGSAEDSTTDTDVADNSHIITEGFPLAALTIFQAADTVSYTTGTPASGVSVLTDRSVAGTAGALMVADTGATLYTGTAAGRRATFPGGSSFDVDNLTITGQALLRRTLQWASGAIAVPPAAIVRYSFEEQSVAAPTLVGHWKMDDTDPGFGGFSSYEKVEIKDTSRVDSYDSSLGTYASQTPTDNAVLSISDTAVGAFKVEAGAYVGGDGYIGSGGTPGSVFDVSGTMTGAQNVQTTNLAVPTLAAPSGLPATSGDFSASSGNTVINSDVTYDSITLSGTATITISGNITIHVSGTDHGDGLIMSGTSQIIIPAGSSLTLYTAQDFDISGDAVLHGDTSEPERLTVYGYGDKHVDLLDQAVMCAVLYTNSELHTKGTSQFYGKALAYKKIHTDNSSEIHQDLRLMGFGIDGTLSVATDETATANTGTYNNDPAGDQTGFGDGGTSVEFDGTDDYLEIPHHASYLLDQGTISLHYYPTSTTGSGGLFSKDAIGQGNGGHIRIYRKGTSIRAVIETTSDDPYGTGVTVQLQSASGVVTANAWNHVAVTWGDGQFRLYANGVLIDSANHLGGLGTTSGGTGNAEPIIIGALSLNSAAGTASPLEKYFTGRIDDVRIYDMPVDAGQAADLAGGSDPGARTAPGYALLDTAGYGDPADLIVYDTTRVSYVGGGGLQFTGDTLITTFGSAPAAKVHDAVDANGQFAVELIIARMTPGATDTPSCIAGYSNSTTAHNFLVGQDASSYEGRFRDSATGPTGVLTPEMVSATALASGSDIHLVFSYLDGEVRVFIDGVRDATYNVGGAIDNWDDTLLLVIGGAYTESNYWNGTIKRMVIYDRALNRSQAGNVYNGLMPGDGSGNGDARWDELD